MKNFYTSNILIVNEKDKSRLRLRYVTMSRCLTLGYVETIYIKKYFNLESICHNKSLCRYKGQFRGLVSYTHCLDIYGNRRIK